jgi:hypothetical protein
MANEPENLDPESWHRHFAIASNNLAWSLVANPSRTLDETARMLDAAHAASFHWRAVGNELNVVRANTLLAEVHALLGFGQSALHLAEDVRKFFLERETEDWELAFVHTIHSHAAYVAGMPAKHRDSYLAAVEAIGKIADEEDRRIVLETFDQVPKPSFDG